MKTILIVDDEPLVRTTLARLIQAQGYLTLTASDGVEAMKLFVREDIDLVFCDILMPKQNGLQTICEMKRAKPGVAVIAISGGIGIDPEGRNVLARAEKIGADSTLMKPFGRAELAAALQKVLGRQV
jgi:YesN/AraC family two-component response regulator